MCKCGCVSVGEGVCVGVYVDVGVGMNVGVGWVGCRSKQKGRSGV